MTCQINGMKICSKCKLPKTVKEFGKATANKDKLACWCKLCMNKSNRSRYSQVYYKNWRSKNLDKVRIKSEKWRKKNPDYNVNYYSKNRQYIKNQVENYGKRNRKKILVAKKKYNKQRLSTIVGKLNNAMSRGLWCMLKGKKEGRSWVSLIGYTTKDLLQHIASKLQPGMTWNNYGKWHIDHIIPKSFFIYEKPEDSEFQYCWSLDNLQPLWAADNISKSNKILIPKKEGKHEFQGTIE